MKIYTVTVKDLYLRDTQIWTGKEEIYSDEADMDDETLWDDFYPEHLVGVFAAHDEKEALELAKKWIGWFDLNEHAYSVKTLEERILSADTDGYPDFLRKQYEDLKVCIHHGKEKKKGE